MNTLFSYELFFALNITPIFLIKEIIQYNITEANSLLFWFIWPAWFIVISLVYTSSIYSIIYLLRNFFRKKLQNYCVYPWFINVFIRLFPFGFVITSICTIVRIDSY